MPEIDREKLSEREIADMSPSKKEEFMKVIESLENLASAEEKLESQKKLRILFERAPAETLPFIVYVIYMGGIAVGAIFEVINLDGIKLWIGVVVLLVIMILPLTLLPHRNWKNFLGWLKKRLGIAD